MKSNFLKFNFMLIMILIFTFIISETAIAAETFDKNSLVKIYYTQTNKWLSETDLHNQLRSKNIKAFMVDKHSGTMQSVSKNLAWAAITEVGSFLLVKSGEVGVMVGSLGTVTHAAALRSIGYSVIGFGLTLSATAGYYTGKAIVLTDQEWFDGNLINKPARVILYPIFDYFNGN